MTTCFRKRFLSAAIAAIGFILHGSIYAAGPATTSSAPAASGPALKYRFTIGKDTTYITRPLLPDGTVDYAAAINEETSKGVTAENNAAVPIIRALGPTCLSGTNAAKMVKFLGVTDLPEKGDYLVGSAEYSKAHTAAGDDPYELLDRQFRVTTQPARSAAAPDVAAMIQANTKPLDLIVSAADRSRFFVPVMRMEDLSQSIDMSFPFSTLREASRMLAARAAMRAADGDYSGATKDLLAIHKLARLAVQRTSLIDHLTAIAIDSQATGAEAGIIRAHLWNEKQAAEYLKQLQQLPEMGFNPRIFDLGERCLTLDVLFYVARAGWDEYAKLGSAMFTEPPPELGHILLDFDELLRLENRSMDQLAEVVKETSFLKRKAKFEAWVNSTFTYEEFKPTTQPSFEDFLGFNRMHKLLQAHPLSSGKARARIVFEGLSGPMRMMWRACEMTDEPIMRSRLNQIGFALEIYRLKHARYPDKLEALSPEILKSVPQDLFVEQPLKYRLKDGGYLLYSVGPDMKDDGGGSIRFGGSDVGLEVPAK